MEWGYNQPTDIWIYIYNIFGCFWNWNSKPGTPNNFLENMVEKAMVLWSFFKFAISHLRSPWKSPPPGEAEDVNSLQVESLEEQQLQLLQARDKAASSRELGDNETSSSWNLAELKWQGPNCNPWKMLWDLPYQLELLKILKLGGMSGNHMAQNTTKQHRAEFP